MASEKISARDLVIIGLLSAVLCVLSPWALPLGPVPVTLGSFAVCLVSSVFGWKRGVAAVGVYVLVGLVGLPVFAGFTGGAHRLFGPTGGFLLGYIPCAALVGALASKGSFWRRCAGMALGALCCYACGTAWYALQSGAELPAALAVCVTPFLPGDVIKTIAAALLSGLLQKRLGKAIN